jgi:hypothetical protein
VFLAPAAEPDQERSHRWPFPSPPRCSATS